MRETWEDTLYSGEWPDYGAPELGTRPRYQVVATYTLQLSDNNYDWDAIAVSYNQPTPAWVTP